MKIVFSLALLILCLALASCESGQQSGPQSGLATGNVDVERVMRESSPAQEARRHLKEARTVLQKGMEALDFFKVARGGIIDISQIELTCPYCGHAFSPLPVIGKAIDFLKEIFKK